MWFFNSMCKITCSILNNAKSSIWNHVENYRGIESSVYLINNSRTFMETASLHEFDITASSFFVDCGRMMKYLFNWMITHWFKVEVWNLHNNVKSNEMYNTSFDFWLEWKNQAVNNFTINCSPRLEQTNNKSYLWSMFNKSVRMIVCIFHNVHPTVDLRIKTDMQNNNARTLHNIQNVIWIENIIICFLIAQLIKHTC